MTLGDLLLAGATGAAVLAALPTRWRVLATRAHVALVLAALLWLVTDFLAGSLAHAYTWAHTRADHHFAYRLAGLWGGEEGTILLWNAVVATTLLLVREARPARLLVAWSGTLAAIGLMLGTFRAVAPEQLALAPAGRGLSDVLLTPLMVIHPPMQFLAYGLLSVPAAYAVASLWEPEHDGAWAGRAYPWARRAWLFATLGLGLGALWAYYVLSFGGYWAWDPVETSNLLPWLALTAFLHAGKQRARGQGHAIAAPLLAYLAFLLTIFATFATRSGLWVSVHAFTDPTDRFEPDAGARLLAILDVHAPTQAFFGLFCAFLLAGVGLYALRRVGAYGIAHGAFLLALAGGALVAPSELASILLHLSTLATPLPLGLGILLALLVAPPFLVAFARAEETHAKLDVSPRTLLAASVAFLAIALGVAFLLNLQVVNGPERAVFDARAPYVALPIASALTIMLALAPLGRRGAVALAAGGLAAGVLGAWLFPAARVLALAAPVCGAAALAAVLKLAHVQGASAPRPLRIAGVFTLLASLLALVMGSNPPTYVGGLAISEPTSLVAGVALFALGALGLLGSVAMLRARGRGLAVAGASAATLAAGYAVGAVLGLAALALVLRNRRDLSAGWPERVRVREAGIYLVHLAVVLGLLGFAGSTYGQERAVFANVPLDAELAVGDYGLALGAPHVSASAGRLDALSVEVALTDRGAGAGHESLDFEWREGSGVYGGRLVVRRTLAEDVYVSPLAFHTASGWVGADSAAGARASVDGIDAVTFSVSVLPLMSLVWAGTWMMTLGMGLILAATTRVPERDASGRT